MKVILRNSIRIAVTHQPHPQGETFMVSQLIKILALVIFNQQIFSHLLSRMQITRLEEQCH